MNRAEKQQFIDSMHGAFGGADTVVVAHYRGLTVAEISDLRVKMRKAGGGFKVTKNKLTQRALNDTNFSALSDMFKGPTAIGYSKDPVVAAKVLVEFAKDNEKLVLVGGAFGDRKLDVKGVEALAKMPSLDELRARIIGMLKTPATRIATVLAAPPSQVARVVGAYAKKG